MNRIILIGNGFDLAHGLPTRYEDFINWYWDRCLHMLRGCYERSFSDGLCTFTLKIPEGTWHSYLWNIISPINMPKGNEFIKWLIDNPDSFEVIQSHLLFSITKAIDDKKWVDIENEYYLLLKRSISDPKKCGITPKIVNDQLNQIQNLLTEYLTLVNQHDIYHNEDIRKLIYNPIKDTDIAISSMNHFYKHCDKWACSEDREWYELMRRYGLNSSLFSFDIQEFKEKHTFKLADGSTHIDDYNAFPKQLLRPDVVMVLSFNYTLLSNMYCISEITYPLHIHGDLNTPQNIIFGYGDELDEDYKQILKYDNNEFLRNIKSVKYLETSNYRNLLSFIEAAPYQIFIMGHSCGNSDRTLLNTLFEHKNCVSIKPFYHKKEDGTDNYMDIVQNISRNFTNMKLMRDRIVNKTYCEPLPQNKQTTTDTSSQVQP